VKNVTGDECAFNPRKMVKKRVISAS